MTREVPQSLLVMLSDERSAGRVLVDLEAFIQFNERMNGQVEQLESLIRRGMPQIARRGVTARRRELEEGATD